MRDVLRVADDVRLLKSLGIDERDDEIITWFMPRAFEIDLEKAQRQPDPEGYPIRGWCSTETEDRQDEIVVAKGLDFTEFVEHGVYNDNHKQDTDATLGEPRIAKLIDNKWWTEGILYKGYPKAERIWELAVAMKSNNARRRLGFSIEGKVLARDGHNRILRAKVRNVAITNCPVNTECTWDAVVKSFAPAAAIEDAFAQSHTVTRTLIRRDDTLTFDQAVEKLQGLRPAFSKSLCRRIVRFAMCR